MRIVILLHVFVDHVLFAKLVPTFAGHAVT
jgi:hypothetical protein